MLVVSGPPPRSPRHCGPGSSPDSRDDRIPIPGEGGLAFFRDPRPQPAHAGGRPRAHAGEPRGLLLADGPEQPDRVARHRARGAGGVSTATSVSVTGWAICSRRSESSVRTPGRPCANTSWTPWSAGAGKNRAPAEPSPARVPPGTAQQGSGPRSRPCGYRQDLARHGGGGGSAPHPAGAADRAHRPAVEAGEKLGFLPGDLIDKVDPYLRPLYDALHDMMDAEKAQRLRERGVIEIAPIAFMRGRTLNDAFPHSRRGPKHHLGADEDVPDPDGERNPRGGDRGHHPERSAAGAGSAAWSSPSR